MDVTMNPVQLAATVAPLPARPELSQLLPCNRQLQIYPNGVIRQAGAQLADRQFMVQGSSPAGRCEDRRSAHVHPDGLSG